VQPPEATEIFLQFQGFKIDPKYMKNAKTNNINLIKNFPKIFKNLFSTGGLCPLSTPKPVELPMLVAEFITKQRNQFV